MQCLINELHAIAAPTVLGELYMAGWKDMYVYK
jgi:hypothetical protein